MRSVDGPLPVLWRDAGLVAVDKPPGMVVIPGRREDPNACVRKVLEAAWGEPLWVVHRLDRDTSGVLLLARHPEAHRAVSLAFERHAVRKWYLAFTRGGPAHPSGTIGAALHHARKGKMRPAAPGEAGALPAQTEYDVRRRWTLPGAAVALVEARPRTGRQHQVRVHLRSIDAPLLVDPLYGGASKLSAKDLGLDGEDVLVARLTLHAVRLEFVPPGAKESVRIEAPLPADLAELARRLDEAVAEAPPAAASPPDSGAA
ncbi:MAG: RluA family pseudouridine synthase [Deltaproteobacteria bacterium]|nr:RluA family pseudouridine synthase [Deltaproteobacteria bacterium]